MKKYVKLGHEGFLRRINVKAALGLALLTVAIGGAEVLAQRPPGANVDESLHA